MNPCQVLVTDDDVILLIEAPETPPRPDEATLHVDGCTLTLFRGIAGETLGFTVNEETAAAMKARGDVLVTEMGPEVTDRAYGVPVTGAP